MSLSSSLFFFFFFSFFSFFFLLLFLARFLLTVPCLWYLTVNHRNRFQISTQLSFPIRSGQLFPQLFSFFFFFFFFFFFPPSFPCSLSSYHAMPLVFNRQSSQPFPNKYATKFSHPLWTTCPSALLSFFFFFFLFFLFFFLLLFLARFLLTVPCLWYLTVNHRNHFQISTQLSFPIRSGKLFPQLFSLFFFFLFFLFFSPFFSLLAFFLPCHAFGI